jgi:anti-anti-sigma regulatory factor
MYYFFVIIKVNSFLIEKPPYHHIIIDCSPLNYIDTFGAKILFQIISEYEEIKVKVFLADCNGIN